MGKLGKRWWTQGSRPLELLLGYKARVFGWVWATILESLFPVCTAELSVLSNSACSTSEAAALERELLDEYRFGRQQLVELCGQASAVAVTKVPAPFCSGLLQPITRVGKLK